MGRRWGGEGEGLRGERGIDGVQHWGFGGLGKGVSPARLPLAPGPPAKESLLVGERCKSHTTFITHAQHIVTSLQFYIISQDVRNIVKMYDQASCACC